jgi:pyruvate dehydrogenase E2 component (dihydrolipoamide acetyltransferase)
MAAEHDVDLESLTGSGPEGRIVKADVTAALDGASNGAERTGRERSSASPPAGARQAGAAAPATSPSARRLADELGVELAAIDGTGPNGRIVREDVQRAARSGDAHAVESSADHPRADAAREPLSRVQRLIADRMVESRSTIPEFTLHTEVAMDEAVALRAELKRARGEGPVPSYNDMVVRACALALRDHPQVNASFAGDAFELHEHIHVGVAVAAEGALLVPTIVDADRKSLAEIAVEIRGLVKRARANALTPTEMSGGTFTVSNLGMFGVTSFTAVINLPQSAILAVGALRREPVLRGETVGPGHRLSLTLSCDHRVLYGADAARFLARVRELLESPAVLRSAGDAEDRS